jgi:AcrR family transcriptional regulator
MKNRHLDESEARAYHHGDLRRALVQASLAIVGEEQDWAFSLREVARRAGVSHNAPYNHFADKNDLLVAVAAAGLEKLRDKMLAAIEGIDDPALALLASGLAYVRVGVENPALYRLIFGPALAAAGARPVGIMAAGARTRQVLEQIVERGARAGAFAIAPDDTRGRAVATLSAWSAVHGLTTLAIDGLADPQLSIDELVMGVTGTILNGLRPR